MTSREIAIPLDLLCSDDNNLTHVSDASILRMSKKVWPLWQKIGELARQEPRISVPDFSTNPGNYRKPQLVSVKVDNAAAQQFFDFLASAAARRIILASGYATND